MKVFLLGVSQVERDALLPILYFLGIEEVSIEQDVSLANFMILGKQVALAHGDINVPVIMLSDENVVCFDMKQPVWCVPLPWRQDVLKPILQQIARTTQLPTIYGVDLNLHVKRLESLLIRQALMIANGVVSQAAQNLQIQRTTLIEKMRRYNIDKSEF